jgi:hypothetical protein
MKLFILLLSSISLGLYLQRYSQLIFVYQAPQVTTEALVVLPSPSPTPSKSEIIGEIAKVFEPEGTAVVVKAISCFYSESGLRWNAYNDKNSNGTTDSNVAQINSVHIKRFGNKFQTDYKENIRVAHMIYKERGFDAWYAPGCHDLTIASK